MFDAGLVVTWNDEIQAFKEPDRLDAVQRAQDYG